MVSIGYTSIRVETSELNVSKSGFTTLFVDMNATNASDSNDGASWTQPLKTITAALEIGGAWCIIYVRPGTYAECVVIEDQHVVIIGVARDGDYKVLISPASGVPMTINGGHCRIEHIGLKTTDANVLVASAPDIYLNDLYVELHRNLVPTSTTLYGIYLNNADRAVVTGCFGDGYVTDAVIGIYAGNGTVDAVITKNYMTRWGSGIAGGSNVGYGIATHGGSQRNHISENILIDNYIGIYTYSTAVFTGNSIVKNIYFENQTWDNYITSAVGGDKVRNGFYGYTGWFEDPNNDGIADYRVNCFGTYDFAPLSGINMWECDHEARA